MHFKRKRPPLSWLVSGIRNMMNGIDTRAKNIPIKFGSRKGYLHNGDDVARLTGHEPVLAL